WLNRQLRNLKTSSKPHNFQITHCQSGVVRGGEPLDEGDQMKAKRVFGLIGVMALFAVCASAFAQDGPPPDNDRNGPPPMQGPGGQMMRRMGGPQMVPLFMRPDVQKELKLTDEQIEKLRQLMPPPPMGEPDSMQGGFGRQGGEMHLRQGGADGARRGGGEGGP